MTQQLRIIIAQDNFSIGNIEDNLVKHNTIMASAAQQQADIIVFPELSITGYPAEDLLLRREFIHAAQQAVEQLLALSKDYNVYSLIGHPLQEDHQLYNVCSLIYQGRIIAQYRKQTLPNYGVFDEARYFAAGNKSAVTYIKDICVGIVICEDLWVQAPVAQAVADKAQLILAPNASPFEADKYQRRCNVLKARAQENQVSIIYVNCIGGQDDLIFDGGSMLIDAQGEVCVNAGFFQPCHKLLTLNINQHRLNLPYEAFKLPSTEEKIYSALVLGVKDYVRKTGFKSIILGLSGGIDSALTLAIAYDALGKDNVHAVGLPSRHTSQISLDDAQAMADILQIDYQLISIEPVFASFLHSLAPSFANTQPNVTEENLQARIRATLLMALSNKFGHLLLTTGNRSEMAVGYCTLYGDMAGAYAPLKDIPKMLVYALANYRNSLSTIIPERTITRAPSAELAPNQRDEDSLPPYPVLDRILYAYINEGKSSAEIIAEGLPPAAVKKIIRLLYSSEYKRKQAAVGPHIFAKSFGKDWRYPICNGFKH